MSDFDDDERSIERLRQLGLLHLRDKPAELERALDRLIADRKKVEEEGEKERLAILARLERERRTPTLPPPAAPPAQPARPGKKTSTLVIGTKSPGTCTTCRHSNQETADYREGHLFCWMDRTTKRHGHPCDVLRPMPVTGSQPVATWQTYHLYQPYDGTNCTFGQSTDLRLLAEDADEKLKAAQKADIPVIE